jgi:hypothetical protein
LISQNSKVTCGTLLSVSRVGASILAASEDIFAGPLHVSADRYRRIVPVAAALCGSHVIHQSGRSVVSMDIERGTILRIDARGRITVQLPDRVVLAELHSGGGGSVGDVLEGRMRPGVHSWRNVGNNILCVVNVVSHGTTTREPGNARSRIFQQVFPGE